MSLRPHSVRPRSIRPRSIGPRSVAAVTVVVVAQGVLSAVPAAGAAPVAAPTSPVGMAPAAEDRAEAGGYSAQNPYPVRTGVKINDPLSRDRAQVLNQQTLGIIKSTRSGQKIRLSEWNIDSDGFVRTALAAHRRGVTFQILMSGGVASRQNPRTGTFARLRRGFDDQQNRQRKPYQRSYIRGCTASCRGRSGINHAKFLTVSEIGRQSGATRYVTSVSSANITPAAGANQWNDSFTIVSRPKVYNFFQRIFDEMKVDRVRGNPYRQLDPPAPAYIQKMWANPAQGRDKVLRFLDPVKCRGAYAGTGGRTRIRVAQTALADARGRAIAQRLRSLSSKGCRVSVVYTLMEPQIREILNRGGAGRVPTRQLVRDTDGDGFYDKYLHTKLTTIRGWYGSDRASRIVRNGTENWTEQSKRSDEVGFDMKNGTFERTYSNWIDGAFRKGRSDFTPQDPNARSTGIDPFKYVEIN